MENTIPDFLKEKLINQYGQSEFEKILEGYFINKPVTLRVNTIKSNIQEVKEGLKKENIKYDEVSWYKDALILPETTEEILRKLSIYEEGNIYLQSLSSMIPPIILEPKEKENILDMAAAPGGKTTQMAALSNNKAYITACEMNKIRAEKLKYNLQKQGVGTVNVMLEDARRLSNFFSFDKILLDAPCSGSGTDNVKQTNFTKELIEKSIKAQEQLLDKALKILKSGKTMVYSTCSILKEENEEILNKVLKKHKASIQPIENLLDIPQLPVTIKGTLCVKPTALYEGFFVAKIKKMS